MNPVLEEKFTKFLKMVIDNTITDVHISSGTYPYIRVASRDVKPILEFGILSYEEIIDLIIFMNPLINQEKIEGTTTGINFIYEFTGTRFRANVSKNNE